MSSLDALFDGDGMDCPCQALGDEKMVGDMEVTSESISSQGWVVARHRYMILFFLRKCVFDQRVFVLIFWEPFWKGLVCDYSLEEYVNSFKALTWLAFDFGFGQNFGLLVEVGEKDLWLANFRVMCPIFNFANPNIHHLLFQGLYF